MTHSAATVSPLRHQGRSWLFADDNINTDLIMPSEAFKKPVDEQVKLVFANHRPGWVDSVAPGDIMIGGRNFGTGSSRPGAHLLKLLGIAAIAVESFNGLFYRNCVNYGLPALECPGVSELVTEGDHVLIGARTGCVRNLNTGAELQGTAMPTLLADIICSGGLLERLRNEGYV